MKHAAIRFQQSYNAQVAVGEEARLIIAASVTQKGSDVGELESVLDEVETNTGELLRVSSSSPTLDTSRREAGDGRSLAPRRIPALLASHLPAKAGSAENLDRNPQPHPTDGPREWLGCSSDPCRAREAAEVLSPRAPGKCTAPASREGSKP